MADYRATIRTLEVGETTADRVVNHHLTERAAISVEMLSGGHLLHLAIAGCLFNDVLREAPNRGITIEYLAVTASGDFDQHGSRGVRYSIDIRSASNRSAVEQMVNDLELEATIPQALRAGASVESAGTTITNSRRSS